MGFVGAGRTTAAQHHKNFVRPHETLGNSTPAVAARLTDHRWTVEELLTECAA